MELMKRIQVLQEDKKALQVANARLVDRANEFESQALRYGRASKVQTKDIEKMKAQIDDLEDGFGSVILGDEPVSRSHCFPTVKESHKCLIETFGR